MKNLRNELEYALVAKDQRVRGSSRIFKGECAEHGTVYAVPHRGHHSTHIEARMRRRYTKPIRKIIRGKLSVQQRKRFDAAWNGKIHPTDTDIGLWDELGANNE